ncbi:MAG: hypothetical protein HY093_03280 [Candidatus Liptonbacteria bacterium]|nr:hypothetical protein [Candidatus Liptonbacteria bacterium]
MPELTKKDIKEVFVETLEPFAASVQKDFQGVNNRLDKVDSRLERVDSRLDNLELGLSEVKADVKWMRDNSGELFAKLDKFIALLEKQEQELLMFGVQLKRLEERVQKLEEAKQ